MALTLLASGLRSAAFCALGYAFWRSLDELLSLVERGSLAIAVAVLAIAAVAIARRRWGRDPMARRPLVGHAEPSPPHSTL